MRDPQKLLQSAMALLIAAKHRAVRYMDKLSIDEYTGIGAPIYGHIEKGTLVLDRWAKAQEAERQDIIKILRKGGLHVRKGGTYEI